MPVSINNLSIQSSFAAGARHTTALHYLNTHAHTHTHLYIDAHKTRQTVAVSVAIAVIKPMKN